jgi:SAM-dependent methyltransferase
MAIDQNKLNELLGRGVVDFGAVYHAAMVVIGDSLGLYKKLAERGPMTSQELANASGTAERYVREWLGSQTAGGYISYDSANGRYYVTEEQAFALADENSPAFLPGAFQVALAAVKAKDKVAEAFRSGAGVGWHEHDVGVFHGTERFFRPGYAVNLISSWIPALDGVEGRLKNGGKVADVGCGLGSSTILMAQGFANASFVGFDYHEPSIAIARQRAAAAGLSDRVHFQVATAKNYPGDNYDFVTFFDSLHDMGDPKGAAAHVFETLNTDGTWMIVEPFAGDRLEDNLNPVGRAYYGASTMICTPASLSQEVGAALGAQAGEARLREVVMAAGFGRFRRATQTPFNLVLEAKP